MYGADPDVIRNDYNYFRKHHVSLVKKGVKIDIAQHTR